jgi:hypothetical protein
VAAVDARLASLAHQLFGRAIRKSACFGFAFAEIVDQIAELQMRVLLRATKQAGAVAVERLIDAHVLAPTAGLRTLICPNQVEIPDRACLVEQQKKEFEDREILFELLDEELPLHRCELALCVDSHREWRPEDNPADANERRL